MTDRCSCLNRCCSFLLMLGLMLVSPFSFQAQAFPGFESIGLRKIEIQPFGRVGYKRFGLNLNFPFSTTPTFANGSSLVGPPPLDLKLRDAGIWVGSVGLACVFPNLVVSLQADGSAKKHVDIFAGENFPWFARPTPFTWSGSDFQLWDADGMIGSRLYGDYFLLGGLRCDKLTLRISNPVDATGVPLNGIFPATNFSGDILTETWIPYFGFQVTATCYRASIIYSPFASSKVIASQEVNVPPVSQGMKWSFGKPSHFFEGSFEYDCAVHSSLRFGLWAKGTWMSSRGNANWTLEGGSVGFPDTAELNTTSTLSRYELGGGMSASWLF
jgi:hypothetical protein